MIENQCQTSGSHCRRQVAADNRRHLTCPQYVRAFGLANARFDSVCWKIRLLGTGQVFGSSKDSDDQRGTGRAVEYGWREPAVQVPGERPEWDERCPSQSRQRFNETSVSPIIRDGSKKKRPVPNPNLHPALFWVRSSPCSADFPINKIAALRLDCSELPQCHKNSGEAVALVFG